EERDGHRRVREIGNLEIRLATRRLLGGGLRGGRAHWNQCRLLRCDRCGCQWSGEHAEKQRETKGKKTTERVVHQLHWFKSPGGTRRDRSSRAPAWSARAGYARLSYGGPASSPALPGAHKARPQGRKKAHETMGPAGDRAIIWK